MMAGELQETSKKNVLRILAQEVRREQPGGFARLSSLTFFLFCYQDVMNDTAAAESKVEL